MKLNFKDAIRWGARARGGTVCGGIDVDTRYVIIGTADNAIYDAVWDAIDIDTRNAVGNAIENTISEVIDGFG